VNKNTKFVHLLRNAVLIDLSVFVLVGLFGLVAGWRSVVDYANGLLIAGGSIIGAGALSAVGNVTITRDFSYLMSESAGVDSSPDRSHRARRDSIQSYSFLLDTVAAGIPLILIGILLNIIF
jgi:hypothetical protein